MSATSKQSIWIDCKALLPLTYQLQNVLSNKDRILIGDKLLKYNVEMIEAFCSAYSRGEEKLTYDNGTEWYDINLRGCKRSEIDRLQAAYFAYVALWEFVLTLDLSRWSGEKRAKKQAEFLRLLAKIEKGITKWRSGTSRQVIISKHRHDTDQTL